MANKENYTELKNKLQQANDILSKPFLNTKEEKELKILNRHFKKEIAAIKKHKAINRKNLSENSIKFDRLKFSPYVFLLREIVFMSVPLFFIFLSNSISDADTENGKTTKDFSGIVNLESLNYFFKYVFALCALISGYHCLKRMLPAHTELSQIYNCIEQLETNIKQLEKLIKKESLLPDLEKTYSDIKERVNSFSSKFSQSKNKLTLFSHNSPSCPNQEVAMDNLPTSTTRRQLFP